MLGINEIESNVRNWFGGTVNARARAPMLIQWNCRRFIGYNGKKRVEMGEGEATATKTKEKKNKEAIPEK